MSINLFCILKIYMVIIFSIYDYQWQVFMSSILKYQEQSWILVLFCMCVCVNKRNIHSTTNLYFWETVFPIVLHQMGDSKILLKLSFQQKNGYIVYCLS